MLVKCLCNWDLDRLRIQQDFGAEFLQLRSTSWLRSKNWKEWWKVSFLSPNVLPLGDKLRFKTCPANLALPWLEVDLALSQVDLNLTWLDLKNSKSAKLNYLFSLHKANLYLWNVFKNCPRLWHWFLWVTQPGMIESQDFPIVHLVLKFIILA